MKKDSFYFSHDAVAQEDPKCVMLIEQLGMEGYGIFWALVERLRCEKDYKLPMALLPALSRRWNTSKEKVEAVIRSFNLFKVEDDCFFSLRLLRSMDEYNYRRNKYIEAGRKGGQASVKHRLSNPQALKESKVNKIKENKSKVNNTEIDSLIKFEFETFWKIYDKNIGRFGCEKVWVTLSNEDRERVLKHVSDYVKSTPDKSFRKNPEKYLYEETWKDEVIFKQEKPLTNAKPTTGTHRVATDFPSTF